MIVMSEIRNRLQEWLEEKGWNYVQAADVTKIHYTTISRIAHNRDSSIRKDVILKLCVALEKRVEDFYYEVGDR